MKDMLGNQFTVGCKVARATMWGKSPIISLQIVTRIADGKLYLDDSKQAIRIPDRLLIIEQDPLIKILVDHQKDK